MLDINRTLHFCSYFREMRDREKHRMEHTEIYSTTLWHLQEDVELSALAQELTKVTNNTRVARYQTIFLNKRVVKLDIDHGLATLMVKVAKTAPEAWCAAGNCFSHLKEHENAIKFFQRAIQVCDTTRTQYPLHY